ncbi:MAG: hypothetical protein KBA66_03185 [Leptospiraceae bacterium]|nr:hypothetical protein [Leptospiraceae bacterium]
MKNKKIEFIEMKQSLLLLGKLLLAQAFYSFHLSERSCSFFGALLLCQMPITEINFSLMI